MFFHFWGHLIFGCKHAKPPCAAPLLWFSQVAKANLSCVFLCVFIIVFSVGLCM